MVCNNGQNSSVSVYMFLFAHIHRISAEQYWKKECSEGMFHASLCLLYNVLQVGRFRIFLVNIHVHLTSFKDSYSSGAVDSGVFEYCIVSFTSISRLAERS